MGKWHPRHSPCAFLSPRASCSWSCFCRATHGFPPQRHWCTVGVLAWTHPCAPGRLASGRKRQPFCGCWCCCVVLVVVVVFLLLRVHVCLGILTERMFQDHFIRACLPMNIVIPCCAAVFLFWCPRSILPVVEICRPDLNGVWIQNFLYAQGQCPHETLRHARIAQKHERVYKSCAGASLPSFVFPRRVL